MALFSLVRAEEGTQVGGEVAARRSGDTMRPTAGAVKYPARMRMRKNFIAFVFVAVAVAGCGGSDNATSDTSKSASETSVESTDETSTTQVTVAEGPKPTCAYTGLSDTEDMQVEVTLTNPLGEVKGLEIPYALLDGEGGTRFFTGTAGDYGQDTVLPRANEQFRFLDDALEGLPPGIDPTTIACTVLGVEESLDLGGWKRASDSDTCTIIGTDPNGGSKVEVAVTSPYDETTTVQAYWALQTQGQVRFGAGTEVTDLVGAGESYRISPEFGPKTPAWVGADPVTCVVLGFWDQDR
jgi:hypothetical protein